MAADPSAWTGHVVVCGLDGVGLRTVEQLHQAGIAVVAVDPAADGRRAQAVAGWGVPLLTGSPRLPQTLHDAGLWGAQAVLCVSGDDLAALETALLVRELRPDVRIAVRLANAAVGEAVTGLGITVLDVASIAAPAVVEACLRRREHTVVLGGQEFIAAEHVATAPGTLRALYGDLAPVAVLPARGSVKLCPGRDETVHVGDLVTVVGTHDELVQAGVRGEKGGPPPARAATGRGYYREPSPDRPLRASRLGRIGRGAASTIVSVVDRSLRISLTVLIALVLVSAVVLRLTYRIDGGGHLSAVQSLYFTAETVATVGFGDFSFAHESLGLQLFGISLIVLGAGLVTVNYALLTNALVSRRVEQVLGRSLAHSMREHVVLIGLGAVGLRVLEALLAAGRQVVVVEADEDNRHLSLARALKVPVVRADATLPETLAAVQVGRAAAVAVLTSNDLVNIETGLAVRAALSERWSQVPVVLRVFDRQLAGIVEQSFGFQHVRSTSALAAPSFVGAALGLRVLGALDIAGETLLLGQLAIAPGGGLDGVSMVDLSARTRVLAITRDDGTLEHPPRRGTQLAGGDVAYLIGPYDEMLLVLQRGLVAPRPGDVNASPANL